jgi:hypothetical protein
MNGMSRIEYELSAQKDTVRALRERLESLMDECNDAAAEELSELAMMLDEYLDCVDAVKHALG